MLTSTIIATAAKKFQSAPGLEAGRCVCGNVDPVPVPCFNPRPALRPGDAMHIGVVRHTDAKFQSAPGLEAGRCSEPRL